MSKIRKWGIIGFAGILLIILVVLASLSLTATPGYSISSTEITSLNKNGLTSHDPIYIDSNADFNETNGVCTGNGSTSNPYIIEGWDISGGISIKNTDAYFVIRNSYIHGGTGIALYKVTHGTVDNVTLCNNNYGIYFERSSFNNIIKCEVSNNVEGIYFYAYSLNNTIKKCVIYNNSHDGITFDYSSDNQIINSTIYNNDDGIEICSISNNNQITNSNIYGNYHGICLDTVDSYTQIINCTVYNNYYGIYIPSSSSNNNLLIDCNIYSNYQGVYIYESSTNEIRRCNIYDNIQYGITMGFSSGNQIIDSLIHNNSYGIQLYHLSTNNQIINCTIHKNFQRGIWFDYSSDNTIMNCSVSNSYRGIYLHYSSNNILRYNNLENNLLNFYIDGWTSNYYQDIDISNTINGKPIYYVIGQENLIFNETMNIGYLALVSCNNITIENLTLTNNDNGLLFVSTSYSVIVNCVISNNSNGIHFLYSSNNPIMNCNIYNNSFGIYLEGSSNNNIANSTIYNNSNAIYLKTSSNNNITNCNIYNNSCGIYLEGSHNNKITYCNIIDNLGYGIFIYYDVSYQSRYNTFHHNNFINNSQNAYDSSTNYWNDTSGEGNYWSDYTDVDENGDGIGDVPYSIFGRYGEYFISAWDNFPLTDYVGLPYVAETSPANNDIDVSLNVKISITFSKKINKSTILENISFSPIVDISFYNWSNEDKTVTLTPVANLSELTDYTVSISSNVKDLLGDRLEATYQFSFKTKDATPPKITILSPPDGLLTNQNVMLTYSISDNIDDVDNITVNISNGTIYSDEGNYNVIINATDRAGNTVTKTITFTIDKTPPILSNIIPATGTKTTKNAITVSGKTEPDADVKINGIDVSVDPNGSFSKEITLLKGENTITITATDLAGNTNTQTIIITKEVKREQKGFIPGFETEILAVALLCICLLIKKKRR